MKIMQVVDHFGPYGGLERLIYDFSRQLQAQGHETLVAAMELDEQHAWGKEPIRAEQVSGGLSGWQAAAEQFGPDVLLWHAGAETAEIAQQLSMAVPLAAVVHGPVCPSGTRLFRDRDEVCCHPSGPACLVRWYQRRCGTHPEPWTAVQALGRADRMLRTLRLARRVYTVSDSLRGFLAIEGIAEQKLYVFDNTLGALDNGFPPLQPTDRHDSLRLLFAGRVVYGKGAQYFLDAVRLLVDRCVSVDATIVGDGWYMEKLKRRCEELGLSRRVRFVGQVPGWAMNEWYDQADVLVVPSIWPEPAGLVVPEGRLRGKPVVVFDSSEISPQIGRLHQAWTAPGSDQETAPGQLAPEVGHLGEGRLIAGHVMSSHDRDHAARLRIGKGVEAGQKLFELAADEVIVQAPGHQLIQVDLAQAGRSQRPAVLIQLHVALIDLAVQGRGVAGRIGGIEAGEQLLGRVKRAAVGLETQAGQIRKDHGVTGQHPGRQQRTQPTAQENRRFRFVLGVDQTGQLLVPRAQIESLEDHVL